jgi:hypothetical protein
MIRQLVHDPTLLSGPFSWIGPLKVSPLSLYIFLSELGQQRSSTRQKVFHWIVFDGANIIWTNTPNISGVSSLLFEKSLLVRFGFFFFAK